MSSNSKFSSSEVSDETAGAASGPPEVVTPRLSVPIPGIEIQSSTPRSSRLPPPIPPRSKPSSLFKNFSKSVSLPPFAPLSPSVIQSTPVLARDPFVTPLSSPSQNRSVIFCPSSHPSACDQIQYHPSPITLTTPSLIQPPNSLLAGCCRVSP